MEWLVLWGVQTTGSFLFTSVMQKLAEDLGKDIFKDILKDVIKGLPGNILQSLQKEDIDKAVGKAIKEFLEIIQYELIVADLSEDEVKQYNSPLSKFLRLDKVKEILGSAFNLECKSIDTQSLERIWYDQNLLVLPEDFDWKRLNKPYIKKVKAIILESDKLRNAFDSYQIEKIADNTEQIAGNITDFDLPCYQESIRQKYGYLKLDSLDPSGSAYNELRLQQVFIAQNVRECVEVLPHIFESSKEHHKYLRETGKESEIRDINELELYRKSYIESPISSVIDIINNQQNRNYLVVLGDPGAGKSTLLQFLALNWAESTLTNSFKQPIPILIELRNYVRQFEAGHCKNFLKYLHDAPGTICHLNELKLQAELKKGNALVMFDGLDEVFNPAQREDIINDVIRFTDEYPNVQVIVTSRVIGYKDERFRNSEFRHLMLQDFDNEQIQDFINRWHQLTFNDSTDAVEKKARLERGVEKSKSIQELAGNPLLLTMMAILNRYQELPRYRSTLYEKASEVLLQQWDAERHLTDARMSKFAIDLIDKQTMLRQVAYQMQANEKGLTGNLINGNDLQQIFQGYLETIGYPKIDAREAAKVLIEQLRQRNFILCHAGDNYYAFVHRTFLEYFCAEAFRWQFEKEQKLTLDQLKTEVFGQHWHDENWHEVLRLIAGIIDVKFVAEIIDYLMGIDGEEKKFSNLFLAAGCLAEVRERKNQDIYAQDRKLFEAINNLIGYGFYRELTAFNFNYVAVDNKNIEEIRTLAVTTIVTTWNEDLDTLPILKQLAQTGNNGSVRGVAVQELARNFKDDPDTLPILKQLAQTDDNGFVRVAAVQELARNFKDDHDTLPILKQRAQTDDYMSVRGVAVQELARKFKDEPDTLPILKQRALTDNNGSVRGAAVQELARNFKDDPNTLLWLKQHAQTDNSGSVRVAAVQELARNFRDDPDTLPILKQHAQTDDDPDVRGAAVQELARNFKDDHDTLPWLKQLAQTDDDSDVRRTAVQELARNFKDDHDTLPILKQHAQTDSDSDVRGVAVQELARNFKDHPDILPWLKQCAQIDDNWNVRGAAVQELARNFKDHPDTLTWLKQRAQADDNGSVRGAAVQELARNFKDHPDTLTWLKQRAQADDSWNVRGAAVQESGYNFKDHPDILPRLKQRAQTDDNWNVRGAAVQELARNFKDHPDTLPILKQIAQTDNNWSVRGAAVQELARNFKDNPDTLPWLKQRAQANDYMSVRDVAVQELARNFRDDPDTLLILKQRAQNDDSGSVRGAAVQELARNFKDDPDTLTILKQRAQTDDDSDVRRAVVQELAHNFKDYLDTLVILKKIAQTDDNGSVRGAAVQELARNFKDHLETLPILKQHAQTDDNWNVRGTAVQELARNFKEETGIFELFCNVVVNDPFQRSNGEYSQYETNPRQTALEIILKHYPNDSQVLSLLRDRATNETDEKLREWAKDKLQKFT
jgi:predicted NACHT family NTPase